jgi:archaetidylinositol phosphate synthase
MLDRLRLKLETVSLKLGVGASKLIPSPTAWTLIGLLSALLAAYAYSRSGFSWQLAAGTLLLLAGLLDIVDGAVARSLNRITKRGSFLDSTLDRLGEVAVFLGIMISGYFPANLVLLTLAFSLLVSYTRAKADSLGVGLAGVGVGERSERILVLAVTSLLGLLYYGLIIVFLLAVITFVERMYRVSAALR